MFVEIDGARFELLAYTDDSGKNCLASSARDSRGRYVNQVAVDEAESFDESKALVEAMVRRPVPNGLF